MARRALAALFASPPQALAPFAPARRALQPDPLGRTVGDLRRLQVAVLDGMPKVQDARVQALGAIEALQCQPSAAVRASGIVERPRPHGQLPTVAALAAPPHSGRIAARDVGRLEGPVPLLVPLRQQIRMSELTCIVFSDMHARGAGHLECNATTTKGNTSRTNVPSLAIEAKNTTEKTNKVMGHSVKRAWVIHLKTKCDPLSSRHA